MPKHDDVTGRLIDKGVGRRIRLRREVLGMTQTTVADALRITFQQFQKYEKGANRVVASRLYQLSVLFGVSTDYFFEDMEAPPASEADALERDVRAATGQTLSRQSMKLLRAFERIPDGKTRQRVAALVDQLSTQKDA